MNKSIIMILLFSTVVASATTYPWVFGTKKEVSFVSKYITGSPSHEVKTTNNHYEFYNNCDDVIDPPEIDLPPVTPYEFCLINNPGCSCSGNGVVISCQWE